MALTYRFETPIYPGNILYVNLIENYSCTNDCLFCSRPRKKEDIGKHNIYEKKAGSFLYLPKSPSVEEVISSIGSEIKEDDKEIAIIGLGEPLIYFQKVIEIIRKVKEKYNIKLRVDTNGLVKCLYDNAAEKLEKARLDEIRISLNAINQEEYDLLCRPRLKNAFPKLIEFIKECNKSKIQTYISFIVGFDKKRTEQEYKDFALSLGITHKNLILRKYIIPIS